MMSTKSTIAKLVSSTSRKSREKIRRAGQKRMNECPERMSFLGFRSGK